MPFLVEIDRVGSTLRRGISTNRYDRALRRGIVTETGTTLLTTNNGLSEAINQIIAAPTVATLFHQSLGTLPLAYVDARKFGPSKALLWLTYARRTVNVPTQPSLTIADFSGGVRHVEWFRKPFNSAGQPTFTNGIPSGPMFMFDDDGSGNVLPSVLLHPRSWTWRQPLFTIRVPFDLDHNPVANCGGLQQSINSTARAFGGFTFPVNTLLFDHPAVRWYETSNGQLRYAGYYVFVAARAPGWVRQFPRANGTAWDTHNGPEYESINWPDASFPI